MPYEVCGKFDISGNRIGNLIGAPKKVGGEYIAYSCGLRSLEGCPDKLKSLDARNNGLESLKYGPEIIEEDMRLDNNELRSLKYSPQEVGGEFNVDGNQLESLEGCPKKIGKILGLRNNKIKSLDGITPDMGDGKGDFGTCQGFNSK